MLCISLRVGDRPCLVVGGGSVAERKVRTLLQAGAQVHVISPEITSGLNELLAAYPRELSWQPEFYHTLNMKSYALVIAATDDSSLNRQIACEADQVRVPINVVDAPEISSFFMSSTFDRGELQIAVSTGGASPALAARIRRELEEAYPESYASYLEALKQLRSELIEQKSVKERSTLLRKLATKEAFETIKDHTTIEDVIAGLRTILTGDEGSPQKP